MRARHFSYEVHSNSLCTEDRQGAFEGCKAQPPEAALQSQSSGVKISFRIWMGFLNLTEAARKC